MANDTKELVNQARKSGFVVSKRSGGHIQFKSPEGAAVIASATPSDRRSIANTRAILKRHGLGQPVNGRRSEKVATTHRGSVQRRTSGVSAAVLKYLQDHADKPIKPSEIRDAVGFSHSQVTNSLKFLLDTTPGVSNPGRGVWVYASNGKVQEQEVIRIAEDPTLDEVDQALSDLTPSRSGLADQIRKDPKATIEWIGPSEARRYLSSNLRNRDLRNSRVVQLAGSLKRGEWELTSNGIAFDIFGRLIDGQHRLSAIIVADKVAQLVVVRGLKAKAQDVMDRNLPRSVNDALKLRGESYTASLGAALAWLYRLDYMEQTAGVHYRTSGERPTTPQMLKIFDQDPDPIRDAVKLFNRQIRLSEVPLRGGVCIALIYRFRKINKRDADQFFGQLAEGVNLKSTDPIYVVRKLLIRDANTAYERMPDYREAALLIKAWNAWREQKPTERLTFKYGPNQRELFPIPQ